MRNRLNKFSFLLCAFLAGSSCTTILFVEEPSPLPPEIEIKGTGNLMVIQNSFDYTRDEYVKEKNEEVFHSAINAFTDGLISYFDGGSLVNCIQGDTLVKRRTGTGTSGFINPDSVVAICNRYQSDLLLSIDSLYIGLDWETETVEDEESTYKVKTFYLETKPFLTLYDKTGALVDQSNVYRQVMYKDRLALSGLITFKPSLEKAIVEVSALLEETGGDYGSKFFPKRATRDFMVYYYKPFDVSYFLMLRGEYADAIRELLPLSSSKDKKTARRAANNLYVAYIGIGDETSADMWYERATGETRGR